MVGVVVGERLRDAFRDPYVVLMLDGLVDALAGQGLAILLLPMTRDIAGNPAEQYRTVPMDALVFATGGLPADPALAVVAARGVPVIGVEGPDAPGVSLVRIDDREGTASAVEHLVELGHTAVAVVTMPWLLDGTEGPMSDARRQSVGFTDSVNRLRGVCDVVQPVAVWECDANAVEAGRNAARQLLRPSVAARPTAVVAQSDVLAAGVVQGCSDLGLRVPEDVSVVGFDGVDIAWLAPHRLTTLVQPVSDKARMTAAAVMARLAGGARTEATLKVQLRLGTTTGPVPQHGT